MYHGDRADWLIIRNHHTVAVIDQSPLRFYAALPLVQFLRPLGVAVCDKNHKIGKPCTNYKHPRKKHRKQQEKPPLLVRKKMHPVPSFRFSSLSFHVYSHTAKFIPPYFRYSLLPAKYHSAGAAGSGEVPPLGSIISPSCIPERSVFGSFTGRSI